MSFHIQIMVRHTPAAFILTGWQEKRRPTKQLTVFANWKQVVVGMYIYYCLRMRWHADVCFDNIFNGAAEIYSAAFETPVKYTICFQFQINK